MNWSYRLIVLLIAMLDSCLHLWGQKPDVVVIEDSTSVSVANENYYTCYRHREFLLNSSRASGFTDVVIGMDPNDDLMSFEYQMFDVQGNLMLTVKKKDLKRVEYSNELATDYYRLIAEVTAPRFPVLIKMTTKMARHGNILSYPAFVPQPRHDMEVLHAIYQITWPSSKVTMRQKPINVNLQPAQTNGGKSTLSYVLDDLRSIPSADLSLDLDAKVPKVLFAPEQILYYGTKGSMADWQSFGLWCNQLATDSHFLPQEVIRRDNEALSKCQTPLEKVKVLRGLMARHTRYVSLQLGIGGYRPKSAGEVYAMGFGDCKGLSNLMRAMLKEAGIESRLVMVGTDEPHLLHDFANFQQMNHMVLEAFLPKDEGVDTLWLECTNPDVPIGLIHSGISGHDAIEVSEQGGRLVTIPEYADTLNLDHTDIYLDLHSDASADIRIERRQEYHRYTRHMDLLGAQEQKMRSSLLSHYVLPNAKVGPITIADDSQLGGTPRLCTHLEASCPKFANMTGRRFFVPVNIVRESMLSGIDAGDSNQPMYVAHGRRDEVVIHLTMPEGFSVESLPQTIDIEEPFASFHQRVVCDGSQVTVSLRLDMRSGIYSAESRTRLAEVQRIVAKAYGAKAVLLKQ